MNRHGSITPRVFELMATVGHVNKFDAKLARSFLKAAGLVAQLASKEQEAFRRMVHFLQTENLAGPVAHTKPSAVLVA